MGYGFKIIVEGDYACFTRPELKVERVSYDVPTPGALEGMLKSVYWKPAIRYVIDKIIVFQEIDFASAVVSYQMIARAKSSPLCAAAHALVQPFLTM